VEFARTRSNRSLRTLLLVLGFVVVAVGATVFLTVYIQDQNRRISVDISDFEDVTLKDLLSSATKNQDDMDAAKQTLSDTQQEFAAKTKAVTDDTSAQVAVVDAQGLSDVDHTAAVQKLNDAQKVSLAALSAHYSPLIRQQQATIADIQKKIDAYDQQKIDAAKKSEDVLNNQAKLHDLELQKIKNYYEAKLKEADIRYNTDTSLLKENQAKIVQTMADKQKRDVAALVLKYNPVFETDTLKALLASPMSGDASSSLPVLASQLAQGSYIPAGTFDGMQTAVTQRATLYSRIARIPWENSVPSAIGHLDFLDRFLVHSYEGITQKLLQTIHDNEAAIRARDARISDLSAGADQDRLAFEFYASEISENGFVLDARDTDRVAVFVNRSYTVADGDQGLIFRADDEYIGTIRFSVAASGSITGRVVEAVPGKQIQPFDKFLIKKL